MAATQTTEVGQENGLDLEAASVLETIQQQQPKQPTALNSINNKDNYDAFENEKTAIIKNDPTLATLSASAAVTEATMMIATEAVDVAETSLKELSTEKKNTIPSDEIHRTDMEDISTELNLSSSSSGVSKDKESSGDINISSNSLLGNDVDNIPEWKKELLQRRKTKIARTIGANQISPVSACNKTDTKSTSPVTPPSPPPSLGKNLVNSNNSSSNSNNKNSSHHITINKLLPAVTQSATITNNQTNAVQQQKKLSLAVQQVIIRQLIVRNHMPINHSKYVELES